MIVAFETEKLRTTCEDPQVAKKELGSAAAAQLRGRLADVRAAASTADLLVSNPRFAGALDQLLLIDLGEEGHMTWTANYVTARADEDGKTDWTRVSRVKLLGIEESR